MASGVRGRTKRGPRSSPYTAAALRGRSQRVGEARAAAVWWTDLAPAGCSTLGADALRAHKRYRARPAPEPSATLAARLSQCRGRAAATQCTLSHREHRYAMPRPLSRPLWPSARLTKILGKEIRVSPRPGAVLRLYTPPVRRVTSAAIRSPNRRHLCRIIFWGEETSEPIPS